MESITHKDRYNLESGNNSVKPESARDSVIAAAPLVYIAENSSQPQKLAEIENFTVNSDALYARFKMLDHARELLPDERIAACMRYVAPLADIVAIKINVDTRKARYQNLERCESDACPFCAPKRAYDHRLSLVAALTYCEKNDIHPALFTFTLAHNKRDYLADLQTALNKSYNRMFSGRWYQDFTKEYGLHGRIAHTEFKYGSHGWHVHLHVLFICDFEFGEVSAALTKQDLAPRWVESLKKQGYRANITNGLDIRSAKSDIAEYVAKWGREPKQSAWGIEAEMTMSNAKRSTSGGLTMMELLAIATGANGDVIDKWLGLGLGRDDVRQRASELYIEFFRAQKGKQLVRWSNGLKKALHVDEGVNEIIGLDDQTQTIHAVSIDRSGDGAWGSVVKKNHRALFLALVRADDAPLILDEFIKINGYAARVEMGFWRWWASGIDF